MTVLLAQIVELLVLSDIVPPSSNDGFPVFGQFMICLIGLITLAIMESVIVSTIYFFPAERKMSTSLKKLINSKLANRFTSDIKRASQWHQLSFLVDRLCLMFYVTAFAADVLYLYFSIATD